MRHTITRMNFGQQLAKAIRDSSDGDVIVCYSEAVKSLAKRAKQRMCPDKDLTFEVYPES